jgi:hypothetical protein
MPKPRRSVARTKKAAGKRAARQGRNASKTKSPARRITRVDAYVSRLPAHQQQLVNRVRALIATAAPEAIETLKWSQPVYEANGPFAYLKAYAGHVNFGFWRGASLQAPEGVLEGEGTRMRHLKLSSKAELDEGLIQRLVAEAVKLNGRLGNPSR